jgi:ribonuclease P protein component
MKKIDIIKSSREYTEIINKGKKIKSNNFSIYYRKNNEKNRYGISIPKKTGKAVIRNKIKRRIKNIIDNNKNSMQSSYDYVIIIRKGILDLTYLDMEKELLNLMINIGDKK